MTRTLVAAVVIVVCGALPTLSVAACAPEPVTTSPPWMAAIIVYNDDASYSVKCAAVVVSTEPLAVATAAHCTARGAAGIVFGQVAIPTSANAPPRMVPLTGTPKRSCQLPQKDGDLTIVLPSLPPPSDMMNKILTIEPATAAPQPQDALAFYLWLEGIDEHGRPQHVLHRRHPVRKASLQQWESVRDFYAKRPLPFLVKGFGTICEGPDITDGHSGGAVVSTDGRWLHGVISGETYQVAGVGVAGVSATYDEINKRSFICRKSQGLDLKCMKERPDVRYEDMRQSASNVPCK